jgi:hypothetical protein
MSKITIIKPPEGLWFIYLSGGFCYCKSMLVAYIFNKIILVLTYQDYNFSVLYQSNLMIIVIFRSAI